MTVIVRFAPSPTGLIHVGNVRTALMNWLYARKQGGKFLLRQDDTDVERSTQAYADAIQTDLAWLGLTHDLFAKQSDRFAEYDAARDTLVAAGRLYPCYETPDELDRKRKRQKARGLPPVYDRSALDLSDEDKAKLDAEGRKAHWRFKLDRQAVEWTDLIRGEVSIDAASMSDPVLIRADGSYLYTLCSIVDDIDFGITHVVRGEDHVANTGAQIQIFKALGGTPPDFAHHPLLVGADGSPLSKRLGSLSITGMREAGYEPMALLSQLAKIGTSDPVEVRTALDELVEEFDFAKISRSPARFDEKELDNLNAHLLAKKAYGEVADRLSAMDIGGGEAFWEAIRDNITRLEDAKGWWAIIDGAATPVIDNPEFTAVAADLLPPEPWDGESWKQWTDAVKEATGAKGRALFMPLRQALLGRDHGPEMAIIMPLIAPDKVKARLMGETA